ncbi:fimbrial biogenesis chaperone [Sinimarinibacterium flocculans]|uniref:Fimbrial chaperone protein n=1 Tax=Sinimarinibacterium flocculans TaxID=985250 RepID=A0A318EK78_9GAMM|nr:molecular chaperone [Sinimarinibacterium flocculans]PXV71485.1 fimbrial chaperone protein [Sinimarinibacterium flocculans]
MGRCGRVIAGWACGALALLSAPLFASGFSVSPTRVDFPADERVQGLRLHNHGDQPIQAQLRVFAWSQVDGEDVLEPSTDLVVSPPMTTLAPGSQQLVRIVRRDGSAAASVERSYRLLVDELPPARTQPASTLPPGLNFVIRYSVPLFIAASSAAPAEGELTWSTETATDGRLRLAVRNPSARHAQLSGLRVLDAQGQVLHRHDGLLGYVLAGAGRSWLLDPPAGSLDAAAAIEVRVDDRHARVPVSH